eukprot:363378-Chlamydomonas_euryale.AAC.28
MQLSTIGTPATAAQHREEGGVSARVRSFAQTQHGHQSNNTCRQVPCEVASPSKTSFCMASCPSTLSYVYCFGCFPGLYAVIMHSPDMRRHSHSLATFSSMPLHGRTRTITWHIREPPDRMRQCDLASVRICSLMAWPRYYACLYAPHLHAVGIVVQPKLA